jgi:hypothetical protein
MRVDAHQESCYTVCNGIGLMVGAGEGEAMKRHWLRGVLLGVSLALLLAGGAALAQGLTITSDKECFTCGELDGGLYASELEPENIVEFSIGGRSGAGECLFFQFWRDGTYQGFYVHPDDDAYYYMWAYCDERVSFWDREEDWADADASPSDAWLEFGYGEWTVEVCPGTCAQQQSVNPTQVGCAETTVVLAQDCSAYEFVPEPGTMMLLGSGLLSLAGYAGLRWRTRE